MEKIIQHPWLKTVWVFIQDHPFLWFVLLLSFLIFWGIIWLSSLIPQIDILKSKILLPIARKYKHRKLTKIAIKSDIRGHVNREIAKFGKYLPVGWAGEMDVDWVENEEASDLKNDNRIIVRIRPVENQDNNFVNATYHYLKSSFFPKTQAVIPKSHYEASVLYVCRKVVEGRSESSKIIFEDNFLEPIIQRHNKIPVHLDEYAHLDKRGFFTGTFLRELHLMANDARFTGARNTVTQETDQVIKHIKGFITGYDAEDDMPATAWYNNGTLSKYAMLLVAHPSKTSSGVDPYINRARDQFQSGARRLYVFGSNNESRFANAVISGIEGSIDGIRLVERFDTPFDYRGDVNGMGAVFEIVS
jgi:hypothetical protein